MRARACIVVYEVTGRNECNDPHEEEYGGGEGGESMGKGAGLEIGVDENVRAYPTRGAAGHE